MQQIPADCHAPTRDIPSSSASQGPTSRLVPASLPQFQGPALQDVHLRGPRFDPPPFSSPRPGLPSVPLSQACPLQVLPPALDPPSNPNPYPLACCKGASSPPGSTHQGALPRLLGSTVSGLASRSQAGPPHIPRSRCTSSCNSPGVPQLWPASPIPFFTSQPPPSSLVLLTSATPHDSYSNKELHAGSALAGNPTITNVRAHVCWRKTNASESELRSQLLGHHQPSAENKGNNRW